MLDAIPLGDAAYDSLWSRAAKEGEDRWEDKVFAKLGRRNLGRLGVPGCIAVEFGTGAIEHGCPVDSRTGRQYGAVVERVAALLHQ